MKTLVLLFTAMLMSITSVTAAEMSSAKQGEDLDITKHYRYAQPIVFVERGVEFLIFPDGSFDYNTNFEDSFYRIANSRRSSVNGTLKTYGSRVKYSSSPARSTRVVHNYDGKVKRIGNVFINYDRAGKVKRIGPVYMKYNRGNDMLTKVGKLKVNYNRWGEIAHLSGHVNQHNINMNTMPHSLVYNINKTHIYNDAFYYYKKGDNIKKHKKRKR